MGGTLTAYRRFLRARRFVAQEAFKQFKATEDWRKENKLNEIFTTIELEEYEQTRQLVKHPATMCCHRV
jgi:thioredoxin-related protein